MIDEREIPLPDTAPKDTSTKNREAEDKPDKAAIAFAPAECSGGLSRDHYIFEPDNGVMAVLDGVGKNASVNHDYKEGVPDAWKKMDKSARASRIGAELVWKKIEPLLTLFYTANHKEIISTLTNILQDVGKEMGSKPDVGTTTICLTLFKKNKEGSVEMIIAKLGDSRMVAKSKNEEMQHLTTDDSIGLDYATIYAIKHKIFTGPTEKVRKKIQKEVAALSLQSKKRYSEILDSLPENPQEQVRIIQGFSPEDQMFLKYFQYANILTSSLGIYAKNLYPKNVVSIHKVEKLTRFALFSDGIYKVMSDQDIEQILGKYKNPSDAAQALKNEARKKMDDFPKEDDDITVIVFDIDPTKNETKN